MKLNASQLYVIVRIYIW